MWLKTSKWLLHVLTLVFSLSYAEDSLKSALNAVNQRQSDLVDRRLYDYDSFGFDYSPEDRDETSYLNNERYEPEVNDVERALYEYLDDKNQNDYPTSPFRERVEESKAKQKQLLEEALLNKLYKNYEPNNEEPSLNKYANTNYDRMRYKRKYNLGWGSVGMKKKRSRYFQPDGPSDSVYLFNYAPRDEIMNRVEKYDNQDLGYNWNEPLVRKRFPVAKRSSGFYPDFSPKNVMRKRSSTRKFLKTDPKVEEELRDIFAKNPTTEKSIETTAIPKEQKVTPKKATEATRKPSAKAKQENKEKVPDEPLTEKPIDVKKKSINWQDYFGLDRRKKSDLDNEWLIDRYHKAVGEKRSTNTKLNEMDRKIQNIEETFIDDALKFTGAHSGTTDPKEIQEVKNHIISRLAAAYSLDKLRQAIQDRSQVLNDNQLKVDEKRVSVPRKSAVLQDVSIKEDNNIKCTTDENCDERHYKAPSELLDETLLESDDCEPIERACNEVSEVLGEYNKVFQTACNMYQRCLLCDNNSWFAPTRQCNVLYISKAEELCDMDTECKRNIRQSIKYLRSVNRSLRFGESLATCNLDCVDKQ